MIRALIAVALSFCLVVVGLAPPAWGAGSDSKRRLVVLEVRAGAKGASEIGMRLAQILRRTTSLDIVDGEDTRRALGSKVEGELARCAGEAACVARIGERLKADQVLLIGVSELGDLIVALQLIDVKTGKVRARVNETLPEGDEPDDNVLESFLRRLLPKTDFRRFGTIRVSASVDGADVEVDGIPRGRTPVEPLVVEAPKRYDLRVRKSGYQDFTAAIDVPPDATVEVKPVLTEEGRGAPWYGKWYVWAIAGTVVAGAVVGTVLLTQDDPTTGGVVVDLP